MSETTRGERNDDDRLTWPAALTALALGAACGGQSSGSGTGDCTDSTHNGDETGVDCGGRDCPRCDVGSSCDHDGDCVSDVCTGEQCQAASCTDAVRKAVRKAGLIAAPPELGVR